MTAYSHDFDDRQAPLCVGFGQVAIAGRLTLPLNADKAVSFATQSKFSQQTVQLGVALACGADAAALPTALRASMNASKIAKGRSSCVASAPSSNSNGNQGCCERKQCHPPSS